MDVEEPQTVPSFYAPELAGLASGETVSLDEDESRHVRSFRLGAGERVVVIDGKGRRRIGWLGSERRGQRPVVLGDELPTVAPLQVDLAVCVGNRTRMLWLIEKVAEFGVRSVSLLESSRSRSVADAGRSHGFLRKADRRALAAIKQSGGAWLPRIRAPVELKTYLARGSGTGGQVSVLLDASGPPLEHQLGASAGSTTLLVGPEGGLSVDEVEACLAAGFRPGSLGPSTLRFETAAVAAIAIARQARLGHQAATGTRQALAAQRDSSERMEPS